MSFESGRHERFQKSRSLFPLDGIPTTLTTTENGSEPAVHSAARANARRQASTIPREQVPTSTPRTYPHEVFDMQVFVDLKVCESCGSLWYRAAGGAQVYCDSCKIKLGEFPVPRQRRRPGGRRKHTLASRGIYQMPSGGGR